MFKAPNAMIRSATPALALAAALAAMPAQADQTLYGTLDLNFSSIRLSTPENKLPASLAKTQGKTHRVQAVDFDGMSQSFVGFAANEKLNDALTAKVVLETVLRADTGASSSSGFWARNAYVGLGSDYGQLRLGRVQTVFFDSITAFDPFGGSGNGVSQYLIQFNPHARYGLGVTMTLTGLGQADIDAADAAMSARSWSNSLAYQSPDIEGVSLALQMGAKEGDANGGNHAVAVHVDGQELQFGFAYQQVKTGLPASLSAVNSRWAAGLSYDFGLLVAYAQGGQERNQLNVNGDSGAIRSNFMQFGAKVPVTSKGDVLVSVGKTRTKPLDESAVVMALGYDHHLTMRTDAYAQLLVDKAQLAGIEGDLGVSLSLGMRHRF
jgi:predicted porin